MSGSRRAKKKKSKKVKKKAKYLDNRHLALRIMGQDGFKKVKDEIGDRLDAIRASKIVDLLKGEYGYKDKDIPRELRDLAAKKRQGHFGGPTTPPKPKEERWYTTGKNLRIGVPLNTLGKRSGSKARVVFDTDKITIYPK